MLTDLATISWWPSSVPDTEGETLNVRTRIPPDVEHLWRCVRPRTGAWASVAVHLRAVGERLQQIPIAQIVDAIDQTAHRWGDASWSTRRVIRDEIVAATGFSSEAVDRSFDVELKNYRADSLWRTLRREFGNPALLDTYHADTNLHGLTTAIGPRLTLAIFTGNVPGLPALSLVRALLVKSPVIAKVASGEPCFAAAFVASLHEALPLLGEAVLVTYWDRDEHSVLQEAAAQVDVVIAYGGDVALRALRQNLPAQVRLIEHGHKFSIGYITATHLAHADVASAIARDVFTFNQHACIAPQAYLVEGSIDAANKLAKLIANALANESLKHPLGTLSLQDAIAVRLARAHHSWRASVQSGYAVHHDSALEWTVAIDEQIGAPQGIGNRFLRVIPVNGLSDLIAQLAPLRGYLQNVGVGCEPSELLAIATSLARIGVSRICEPGQMAEPSMMWRHDGRTCIAELVNWCDIEMHQAHPATRRFA